LDYVHDLRIGPEILKNYIFCYCFLTKKLVSFFYQIKGVISFLNHERRSLQLPDPVSEITVKKTFSYLEEEKKEIINSKSSSLSPISIGDYVKITGGIFANHEGRIIYLKKENNRVGVEIYFFNRNIDVNLPINNCQKMV
jgi:transcription antitermination factor NusG